MNWSFLFFLNSILFGVGLAMDTFSVSVVHGLEDRDLTGKKKIRIAGTFAAFQILMPLLGWFMVHTIMQLFLQVQRYIPWIGFSLLMFLGIRMILEARKDTHEEEKKKNGRLILEGIATSIDALSVGFTIGELPFAMALTEALIIGAVTYLICTAGLRIGTKVGEKVTSKAPILGGVILIVIAAEILLKGLLGG